MHQILRERDDSIPKESILQAYQLPESSILDVSDIPIRCGLLSDEEIIITEKYSAVQLVRELADGQLTAEQVLRAYLKRAGIVHQLTNCATEFLSDEAIARARYLDEHFQRSKQPLGPLHGLPISIKDFISMRGRRTHAGYIAWIDRIATDDALIVKILYEAGAIFYVRTTQPQSLMHLECTSTIFGTTVNPYNRKLTSGGSSGGEGPLLALHGSPLGLGTDIGGSIRSPAANNGVYGLRPTTFRIPKSGLMGVQIGRESIVSVIGPLARTREDLELFMKVVIDTEPWLRDPALIPIPWRSIKMNAEIFTVAIMWDDGVVHPHPPINRALRETVEQLRRSHIRVIDWEPIDHLKAWNLTSALYYCNGAEEERKLLNDGNEEALPLTEWIFNQSEVKERSWSDMNALIVQRDCYRQQYVKTWNERENNLQCSIDCLLTPVGPSAAPQHGTAKWWGYTSIWNLLDYPAVVFPVSTVNLVMDQVETNYHPRNIFDEENYHLYTTPALYEKAPISLQVVCRRYCDEKLLQCLAIIEQAIGRN